MKALRNRGWGILAGGGRRADCIFASLFGEPLSRPRHHAVRHFSSTNSPPPTPTSVQRNSEGQTLEEVIAELKAQGVVLEPHPVAEGERPEPWKKLLGVPARAAWRVGATRPPPDFDVALQKILQQGGRTRKQLKQTLRTTMQSHQALARRRERERLRLVNNREYKAPEQRTDEGILPVLYGPNEALASFYFRSFPQYVVVQRVLREVQSLLGGVGTWAPKRVLDFGVGGGSASAAALHTWKDSIEWVHGIDCSKTMRQGAQLFLETLIEQQDEKHRPKTTFAAHLSATPEASSGQAFDLALLSYTATEFTHNSATVAAAALMFEKLRPGGLFVMVEPGTPDGFNSVRTVRNMLLDCCPPEGLYKGDEECHILAPCTHNGRCPMERLQINREKHRPKPTQLDHQVSSRSNSRNDKNAARGAEDADSDDDEEDEDEEAFDDDDGIISRGYCSFVQTMPSKHLSSGEKFSYLVAQKRITGDVPVSHQSGNPHPFDNVNLRDLLEHTGSSAYQVEGEWHETPDVLLQRAVDLEEKYMDKTSGDALGLDFVQGDHNRRTYGRIIHAPKKRRGHVLIDTCIGPGKIVRNKVNKSLSKAIPGIFSASRKSRWGGFWPIVDELQEDDVFRRKTDIYKIKKKKF